MNFSKKRSLPGWNTFEYLLVRTLVAAGALLSFEHMTGMARTFADALFFCMPSRRKIALNNLANAFPEVSEAERRRLARESFRNLCTSLMEFFRTPAMVKEAPARFEIEGSEHMDEGFRKGKGIIFVVSHLGSWEYLAFLAYLKNYPFTVIVRDTRNPLVHRWITDLRKVMSLTAINRKNAVKTILKDLKQNRVACVLIDQWASADGLWIDFFGKGTSTTSLPARLASHTGAVMIPGYCLRTAPGRYRITVGPEVPLAQGADWEKQTTIHLNQRLEAMIRRYPDQWSWTHRRWKSYEAYVARGGRSLQS